MANSARFPASVPGASRSAVATLERFPMAPRLPVSQAASTRPVPRFEKHHPRAASTPRRPENGRDATYTADEVANIVDNVASGMREAFKSAMDERSRHYELMLHRLYHIMRARGDADEALDYPHCSELAEAAARSPYEAAKPRTRRARGSTAGASDTTAAHAVARLERQFERIATKHDKPLERNSFALKASADRMKECLAELRSVEQRDGAALAASLAAGSPLGRLLAPHAPPQRDEAQLDARAPQRSTGSQRTSSAVSSKSHSRHPSGTAPEVSVREDAPNTTANPWSFSDLREQLRGMAQRLDETLERTLDPLRMRAVVNERRRSAGALLAAQRKAVSDASIRSMTGVAVHTQGHYGFSVQCQTESAPEAARPECDVRGVSPEVPASTPHEATACANADDERFTPLAGSERLGLPDTASPPVVEPSLTPSPLATRRLHDPSRTAATQTVQPDHLDARVQADADAIAHEVSSREGGLLDLLRMQQGSPGGTRATESVTSEAGSPSAQVLDSTGVGPRSETPPHGSGLPSGLENDLPAATSIAAVAISPSSRRRSTIRRKTISQPRLSVSGRADEVPASPPLTFSRRSSSRKRLVQTRDVEIVAALGEDSLKPLRDREHRVLALQATFNRLFFALSTTAQSLLLYTDGYEADLQCRCCFNLLAEPATLWPCGHTFCAKCIDAEMVVPGGAAHDRQYRCRDCGRISHEGYTPNATVASLVARWHFKQNTVEEPRVTLDALRQVLREVSSTEASAEITAAALSPPRLDSTA